MNIKLEKVKEFLDKNKRIPNIHDNDEKQIALWIIHQKQNFKKRSQVMKNENIRNVWINFIEDNKYKKLSVQKEKLKEKTILVKGKNTKNN